MGLGREPMRASRTSAPTGFRDAKRSNERMEFEGQVGGDGAVCTVPRLDLGVNLGEIFLN